MSRRFISLCTALLIVFVLVISGATSVFAAENEKVRVLNDFEDDARFENIDPFSAGQAGQVFKYTEKTHSGAAAGAFVSNTAYAAIINQVNYNNKVSVTYDGELMMPDHSNCYDAFRIYICNPGADVTIRLQWVTSLGQMVFMDKLIPSSTDYVAYDYLLKDFIPAGRPDDTFADLTDPLHGDIYSVTMVYHSGEIGLKTYLDDFSLVKYDYQADAPTTTTTKAPTTTTTEAPTTTATEADATTGTEADITTTTEAEAATTTTAEADATTTAADQTGSTDVSGEEGGVSPWLIVGIVVGVLVIAGVVVFVVLKTKKPQA